MQFRLFSNHIELAHSYWKSLLQAGDIVIDATCGNGHDSLYLAKLGTKLYLLDIQQAALDQTMKRLSEQAEQVYPYLTCHSRFPEGIEKASVSLIVYNLGYLPGGDKTLTTQTDTTLLSLENALQLVKPGGAISITCYPGHPEGKREEDAITQWAAQLNPFEWNCCHHRWLNSSKAPSLLLLQRRSAFVRL
jgi:SAM-dependent methyltransferase